MKDYYVNLTGTWSRENLHDRLSTGLYLPGNYGRNLDALYDVMTEFRGRVHLYGSQDTGQDVEEYVEQMCRTMEEAAEENPLLEVVIGS